MIATGLGVVAIGTTTLGTPPVSASGSDPVAFVTSGIYNNVTPIDTVTNSPGTPIPMGNATSIALTPDGTTAYVSNDVSETVTPITTATDTVGTPIPVPDGPEGIAITPDGTTAYVVDSDPVGTVTPIDVATNTAGSPIAVGAGPAFVAITPNGATAYVTNFNSNTVTPISTATNTPGTPIPVGTEPYGIAITPDGSTVYVVNSSSGTVTPISTATNTPGTPIPVGSSPQFIAITPDGATAFVGDFNSDSVTPISTATNTAGPSIPVGSGPRGIAISPDGRTAYVINGVSQTVSPIDIATDTAGTPIPVNYGSDIAITPDQAPEAQLSVTPAPTGSPTTLDASASVAPSSPITSYAWKFGDGNTESTPGPTVTHSYTAPGTYTASVTETDQAGTSTTQVFTGQTVSLNGGPGAVATAGFQVTACAPNTPCSASGATAANGSIPATTVSATGTSTTTASMTVDVAIGTLSCGTSYDYPTAVSTLTETTFTSSAPIHVREQLAGEPSTRSVKICYQPDIPSPPPPVLLAQCPSPAVAPCVKSLSESGGSVDARFLVPAGDPRFWMGPGGLVAGSFSPTSAAPGRTVTLKGSFLKQVTAVSFGGQTHTTQNFRTFNNKVVVKVPDDAQSGAIWVYANVGGWFYSQQALTVS